MKGIPEVHHQAAGQGLRGEGRADRNGRGQIEKGARADRERGRGETTRACHLLADAALLKGGRTRVPQ
tara:strand:- start:366 stop:569 length:204 start_codon:yes stop_codon:yes gene_type:complete